MSRIKEQKFWAAGKEREKDMQNCGRAWVCACVHAVGGRIGRTKEKYIYRESKRDRKRKNERKKE